MGKKGKVIKNKSERERRQREEGKGEGKEEKGRDDSTEKIAK